MDFDYFLSLVKDQFFEEDQASVTAEVAFRKLGTYDSLTGMAIITTLEDEYKVSIPVEEYKKINTVNELFEYVKNKI